MAFLRQHPIRRESESFDKGMACPQMFGINGLAFDIRN